MTFIGWSGHSGPKIDVRAMSSTVAATTRRLYSSWAKASRLARRRVPTQTASAPERLRPLRPCRRRSRPPRARGGVALCYLSRLAMMTSDSVRFADAKATACPCTGRSAMTKFTTSYGGMDVHKESMTVDDVATDHDVSVIPCGTRCPPVYETHPR